jgi:hypothetical protein
MSKVLTVYLVLGIKLIETADGALLMEPSTCRFDIKSCEKKQRALSFQEICKKIQDKNAFYYSALENINPRLGCPAKPGNHSIPKASLDLSILSAFAFDDNVWNVKLKLYSNSGKSKIRKIISCVDAEIKISKIRVN